MTAPEWVRPTWDETWLELALSFSKRAACTRSQVGAVLIRDNHEVYPGYNGVPSGQLHCTDGGCPRGLLTYDECAPLTSYSNCPAIHAEDNALRKAGDQAVGSTVYITRSPCGDCTEKMRSAGVVRAVWPGGELTL